MENIVEKIESEKKQDTGKVAMKKQSPSGVFESDNLKEIEKKRKLFIEEREFTAALRKQNQPLWQYESSKLPGREQEEFRRIIREVIDKEENTEMEVAIEEALKMNEDIEGIFTEGKADSREEACARVFEKKEYQLKGRERIEHEESVRPYFLLIIDALEKDDLELAQGVIKTVPPDKKNAFGAVRDILNSPIEKKGKQYAEEENEDKLVRLMGVWGLVSNHFDVKNLENVDKELRQSPVFVNAAKRFLANKLEEIINISGGQEIKEYIWVRDNIIRAGVAKAEEIDSDSNIQWKLKTVLIGKGEDSKPFFIEQVERYQYLKSQLEIAGIIKKDEINRDPRVQDAFSSILNRSFDESVVLSDDEIFRRYLEIRKKLFHYRIMDKKEMDWNEKMQENFYEILLKQFSLDTGDEEKIRKFLDFYQQMAEEEMIPPEMVKKLGRDNKLIGKLRNSLNEVVSLHSPSERKQFFSDFRDKIIKTGLVSDEIIDGWKILENQPVFN